MGGLWPMVSALSRMTSWFGQNIGCFSPNPFYCQMTRLIPGATTPLPSQIFLRTSFCQFCHRSSATWTKNTWKHQILAKSHTNNFGRLAAKFQQTAISSICLGAFKRFSAMISASFCNLIFASEKGRRGEDGTVLGEPPPPTNALRCKCQPHQPPKFHWACRYYHKDLMGLHMTRCMLFVHFSLLCCSLLLLLWLVVQTGLPPKAATTWRAIAPQKLKFTTCSWRKISWILWSKTNSVRDW